MESREEPGPGDGVWNPEPVTLSERVIGMILGISLGLVVGLLVTAALDPFVSHWVSNGIGKGTALGIALCFTDGYPRANWREVTFIFSFAIAGGLLISFLRS